MSDVFQPKPYCVYTHSLKGVVFYVGKGRLSRPFDKGGRNREWLAITSANPNYSVDVIGWFDSDDLALQFESEQIHKFKSINPSLCNFKIHQHFGRYRTPLAEIVSAWRKGRGLNARDAANELGISVSTLFRVERFYPMDGATLAKILRWMTESV